MYFLIYKRLDATDVLGTAALRDMLLLCASDVKLKELNHCQGLNEMQLQQMLLLNATPNKACVGRLLFLVDTLITQL